MPEDTAALAWSTTDWRVEVVSLLLEDMIICCDFFFKRALSGLWMEW